MTTVLADWRLGVMVSDSSISDGDRIWIGRKVFRWRGDLLGFCGDVDEAQNFIKWWKAGKTGKPPKFTNSECLVLSRSGLIHYSSLGIAEKIPNGIEAIGTGAKAAMCAYEALSYFAPALAVGIVCKHDSGSRKPVRTYKL